MKLKKYVCSRCINPCELLMPARCDAEPSICAFNVNGLPAWVEVPDVRMKDIIQELMGNLSYQENIAEILELYFTEHKGAYREWLDWFDGKVV